MSEFKVMIVDDDPVIIEIATEFFRSRAYEVHSHHQALGTTAAIVRARPDVVLLDIHMPGFRGDELLKAIREHNLISNRPPPEFIFYSGDSEEDLAQVVADTGALGAIQKTGNLIEFAADFDALVAPIHQRRAASGS